MVPIRTGSKGEAAALTAAIEHIRDIDAENGGRRGSHSSDLNDSNFFRGVEVCLCFLLTPFLWMFEMCHHTVRCGLFIKHQARRFLYGEAPYKLSVRITVVNLVVFCNTWVIFIDQLRLAFFPPKADNALAILSW